MKTGIIAADGHNFPNLALMKIAAFHKLRGVTPFAQPYRDSTGKSNPTTEQIRFARYVNRPEIFKTIEFKDYKTNKNPVSGLQGDLEKNIFI
jgi:hypothetical protein